jgi:hypothetical protein
MIHTFPARPIPIERKAKPLVMPPPREWQEQETDESNSPWIAVDPGFATPSTDLNRGISLVLLALLDFFGGRKPTRGDDPPGAEARPFKLEMLNAIAGRRSSRRSLEAAAAQCEEFPYAAAA